MLPHVDCLDEGSFPVVMKSTNEAGLAFYENVFRELKKYNIEPVVTLSHYEMPLHLVEEYGSWRNRKIG